MAGALPKLALVPGFIVLLIMTFSLSGCESIAYYGQAVQGQLKILAKRQPISGLLSHEQTSDDLKARLETVVRIREFALTELGLPVGKQFSSFVNLDERFVVWNVFATPEFSLEPVSWCYPIAGCVTYRGYFSEAGARKFADSLAAETAPRLDIYVGGVTAYSTLGWFSDPVLSTVINRAEYQLASLIFHELAHQVVYIKGDTRFNESFATAVAREGLQRWLLTYENNENAQAISSAARLQEDRNRQFVNMIEQTRATLATLYGQAMSEDAMREAKTDVIAQLQSQYDLLRQGEWQNYSGYDGWFANEINNAQLSTVATYNDWVPAFLQMLENIKQEGGGLPEFYQKVMALEDLDSNARNQVLQSYDAEFNQAAAD